jgi:hypothetical protein
MKRFLSSLLSIGSLLLVPGLAAAQSAHTYNIGYDSSGNDVVVCEVIAGSSDMIRKVLKADSSTLSANVVFDLRSDMDATDGIDTITVYAGTALPCDVAGGGTLGAFTYNGKMLTIYGGDNADTITGGTGGLNDIYGGADNDDLLLLAVGAVDGEAGADRVRSNFSGGSEVLLGGNGDDCLQQLIEGTAPTTFDCQADSGTGNRDRYNALSVGTALNCETNISPNNC